MANHNPITTLEEAQSRFTDRCEVCKEKVDVHGFRKRSQIKRGAIYASCKTKECRQFQREICYLGA